MPRIARTLDLLADLEREEAPQRQGHLSRKHGRAALNEARRDGAVHALLPRIFAHHRTAEAFTTRAHAAMEWLPSTVALTGLAACAVHGLLEDEPQHLRAAAPSPLHVRSPRWLTLRRCTRAATTTEIDGIRVATVSHAIIHAWEEDPTGGAREAIFAALREGKTTVAKIRDALSYYPRVKGRRRFLAFLAHLHNGMHSWLEYVGARTVLNTPDLACFKYQRRFVLEGHVFFADRYDPDSQTLVEFDSARFHGTPEQRAYDAWRDELFRRAGYDTVRLPYPEVIHSPRACRAKVRAKVAERLAGAPPPRAS